MEKVEIKGLLADGDHNIVSMITYSCPHCCQEGMVVVEDELSISFHSFAKCIQESGGFQHPCGNCGKDLFLLKDKATDALLKDWRKKSQKQ